MKIGVIGLGIMGGSLALASKRAGHVVFGHDINENTINKAIELQAIDSALTSQNASDIDILVVSVFPSAFMSATEKFLPYLKSGAVVCDFCGIKRKIVSCMEKLSACRGDLNFVGGHPMAGREVSGLDSAKEDLFEKASMILVPVVVSQEKLMETKDFFSSLGFSKTVITDGENHDAMIAFTSQLCHVVSNAFIKNKTAKKHFGYSAGSYKDMTRVAKLDPIMWGELMSENSDKLLPELEELIANLSLYCDALKSGDKQRLIELLSEGNQTKLSIDKRSD